MATVFTHGFLAAALALAASPRLFSGRLVAVLAGAAVLPDLDVVGWGLGISLDHPLGHRGWSHSLVFAAAIGMLGATLLFRHLRPLSRSWWGVAALVATACASHGVLDALTDGGRGVAFLLPFTDERYFFPWRPIHVSPIGVAAFFTRRSLSILQSELVWIWLPVAGLFVASAAARLIARPGVGETSTELRTGQPIAIDAD